MARLQPRKTNPTRIAWVRELTIKQNKRTGLRICGARGHPEVRAAFVRFARWLRANHEFPIRVPVYLSPLVKITTMHRELADGSFVAPFDRNVEPHIRIATGDYPAIRRERGRDDALAEMISCLCHEIIHYQQWIGTGELWERGVGRQQTTLLHRYSSTVDHP